MRTTMFSMNNLAICVGREKVTLDRREGRQSSTVPETILPRLDSVIIPGEKVNATTCAG